MKKLMLVLLMVCLLVVPAHAEELTDQPIAGETNQQEQENCIIVGTLEELLLAMETANDGDCIGVSQTIYIERDCDIGTADKQITVTREDGFLGNMINIRSGNVQFTNIIFDGKNEATGSAIMCYDSSVKIERCNFSRNTDGALFISYDVDATISDCVFTENKNSVISSYSNFKMSNCLVNNNSATISCINISTINGCSIIEDSKFENNTISGEGGVFCIFEPSRVEIADCYFIGNLSENGRGAAIYNGGETTVSDCLFLKNKSGVAGDDIYNWGNCAITVINTDQELTDLYNRLNLIYDGVYKDDGAKLYPDAFEDNISNDEIEENRFVDCAHSTRIELPIILHRGGIHFEAHEKPEEQQPEGQPGDNDQLPEGTEDEDNTEDKTDPTDKPTDDTQQKPQEPADGGGSRDDDTTDYRPPKRPAKPSMTIDEEQSKPQEQPENPPAPAQSPLVCNGATIDISRSVVLLGYGDGLIHEDDYLTRAQMATIIFRLLDDDSVALYRDAQLDFVDVPADAWYTDYVRVIQAAGIVNGIGGGRYNPDGLLTWGQTLAILSRFVEPQEYALQHIQYNGWALQAVQTAVAYGWIEDSITIKPDDLISRGQLEELLNYVLVLYR